MVSSNDDIYTTNKAAVIKNSGSSSNPATFSYYCYAGNGKIYSTNTTSASTIIDNMRYSTFNYQPSGTGVATINSVSKTMCINNDGACNILGGTIQTTNTNLDYALYNTNTMTISGNTYITSPTRALYTSRIASGIAAGNSYIYDAVNIIVSGNKAAVQVDNQGTTTISASKYGNNLSYSTGPLIKTTNASGNAIYIQNGGTVTLGNNENPISDNRKIPTVKSKNVGIYMSSGTLRFYDGAIYTPKSRLGINKSSGTITCPTGYKVQWAESLNIPDVSTTSRITIVGNDECKIDHVVNSDDSSQLFYSIVPDAVYAAINGQKIELLENITRSFTVPSGKDICLELAGFSIDGTITNYGRIKEIRNGTVGSIYNNKYLYIGYGVNTYLTNSGYAYITGYMSGNIYCYSSGYVSVSGTLNGRITGYGSVYVSGYVSNGISAKSITSSGGSVSGSCSGWSYFGVGSWSQYKPSGASIPSNYKLVGGSSGWYLEYVPPSSTTSGGS